MITMRLLDIQNKHPNMFRTLSAPLCQTRLEHPSLLIKRIAFLRNFLLMASLFSAQEASAATEEIHEMRPFEVIGTRLVRDYMDNLGPAGIVPATGHSEQVRPSDTWTAMSFMPGLHVEQPSSLAGNTVLYLRGGEPNFTKVLFDGIELNNLNSSRGGTYNFNGISLIGVERIEVLAGAHSSVYGSDAISGVINI